MSGAVVPVLLPLPNLPSATLPLGVDDLLLVEQDNLAKKAPASAVLPGGTITAHYVYAGPSTGDPAIPAFRLLVASDIPATLNSTNIDGTLDADSLTVNGHEVLRFAQQGTVTAYGSLIIGGNLTLDANGTLSAAGGGAGSGTVDVGTINHLSYYTASAAEVGSAPYAGLGTGANAGVLTLGQAGTRFGGVLLADSVISTTGTLLTFSNLLALLGANNGGTVDGMGIVLTAGNATSTGNGGDIIMTLGTTAGGSRSGQLRVLNLGTADSGVANSVWADHGVLVQTGHTATAAATLVAGGVLAGGTQVLGTGTVSLFVGAGLSNAGSGTITNSGVLQVGTLTGSISLGGGLSQTSGTLANAGVIQLGTATGTIALSSAFSITSGTLTASGLLQAANNLTDVSDPNLARRNINQGVVALSGASASIATNAALGNVFTVTLVSGTGPYTLAAPTNMLTGATYIWRFTQPGSGSAQTLTYASVFKFAAPYTNASPPALTASLSALDVLTAFYDGTNLYASLNPTFA